MKKIILTVVCLAMSFIALPAQDIKDRASYTLNIDQNLWYNTDNAAGLSRDDLASWRDVSFNYALQAGAFTDSWSARTQSEFNLSGDTFMDIEGFKVAADVYLGHDGLKRTRFNNSLYELKWDMPFFVALNSEEPMKWGRNRATVNVSASTPLLFDDMFTFGLNLGLEGRTAAKKAGPSARYSDLTVRLSPSATLAIDPDNVVGLAIYYETNPARSVIAKGQDVTTVAILQGLGEFLPRTAGGESGFGPLKLSSYLIGAGAQFCHTGDAADFMAEASLRKGASSSTASDNLIGTVDKYLIGAHFQGLFGDERNKKLTLDFDYNLNYWIKPLGSRTIANNNLIDANLEYTSYTRAKRGEAFDWMFGAGIDFWSLSLKRVVPDGLLTGVKILPYAFLGKNLALSKEESLFVKANLGYNFSINSDYQYGGLGTAGNYFVNYMYDEEVDYLSRYFLATKLDATYTYQVNTFFAAYASLGVGYQKPMGVKGSRLAMLLSVGVMF